MLPNCISASPSAGAGAQLPPTWRPAFDGNQHNDLSGVNAVCSTRIGIDFDSSFAERLKSLGLLRVDAPMTKLQGPALVPPPVSAEAPSTRYAGAWM